MVFVLVLGHWLGGREVESAAQLFCLLAQNFLSAISSNYPHPVIFRSLNVRLPLSDQSVNKITD
eukprot:3771812-Rhodomonas_salina.1